MRRFALLAALLLPLLVPTAVHAGTCPALEGGVVDRTSYRLGEVIDFYGTYHDFANPGNVTITFERTTDDAVREYPAFNSPDGSWYLMLEVTDPADIGRWDVTVVVTQTGDEDTCTDTVTIRGAPAPNTAAASDPALPSPQADPLLAVIAAVFGLWAGVVVFRRGAPRPG